MPTKPVSTSKTSSAGKKAAAAVEPVKAAAAPARATKTVSSRVKSVRHSAPAVNEPAAAPAVKKPAVKKAVKAAVPPAEKPHVDAHAEISRIAYGYWVSRGCQGGSPADDWFRAEAEFAQRNA